MKTFSELLEMWEHPFSGKDYYDDKEGHEHEYSGHSQNHMSDKNLGHSEVLAAHYREVNNHPDLGHHINNYQDGSNKVNRHAIGEHKYGENHLRGLTQYRLQGTDNSKKTKAAEWKNHDFYHGYEERAAEVHEHMLNLDKAVSHTTTPHDMHVYSGLGFHPAMLRSEGGLKRFGLHLPAFTSTTIRPAVGLAFAKSARGEKVTHRGRVDVLTKHMPYKGDPNADTFNLKAFHPHDFQAHLLKIHIPKGSHGLYLGHRNGDTFSQEETEFLLPRHARVVIGGKSAQLHRVKGSSGPWGHPDKMVHIWHAKLVHDGVEPTRHMEELS
jgi:hypothetical protein